jgi:hypothetical protein
MNVSDIADLARIRHAIGRLNHDDERLGARAVTLHRNGATVTLISCSSDALAFDALRLVCGLRLKRENAAAWAASELALAA